MARTDPTHRDAAAFQGIAADDLVEPERLREIEAVAQQFAVGITPALSNLIREGGRSGPIGRQFVPGVEELVTTPEESSDPIADDLNSPVKGIVHRHPDRVLFMPVNSCPAYCRFCFRKNYVRDPGRSLTAAEMTTAMDYLRDHPEIWEVILTGGEPLVLSPCRFRDLLRQLDQIAHLGVLRIHTRMPVISPERVTSELVEALKCAKPVFVVLHCNHPTELSPDAVAACARLIDRGIPMLSQTVLLKGVNDDVETMKQLFRRLVEARVKPYYLHHADLAAGTSHFRTSLNAGQEIMRALRGNVSGLCQPTYVLDLPGGYGKVPVGPQYLRRLGEEGAYQVTDYQGIAHVYPPPSGDAHSGPPAIRRHGSSSGNPQAEASSEAREQDPDRNDVLVPGRGET